MKKLIKEYLQLCIYSKKSLRKEISRLDKCVKQLYEITSSQQIMFEEYSKESYKEKWKREHKKVKDLLKIINGKDDNNEN